MNKENFLRYIQNQTNNLSLEEKKELLKEIKNIWIPSIETEMINNKIFCPSCKKYIDESKYTTHYGTEVRFQLTYFDYAYGEDDEYGDVKYFVKYRECPFCHNREKIDEFRVCNL